MQGLVDNSARWYLDFLNSVPLALFRTTIEGRIVFCNRAFAKMFGFDATGELIGHPVVNLYRNKKDRGVLIHTILQRGRVIDLPISLLKADQSPFWCAVTARAVLDDDGMVVHLDGILRDITDEIEEKGAMPSLDSAVSAKNDMIFVFDLHGGIIDANEPFLRMLGCGSDELRGTPLIDFLIPAHRDFFLLFLSDILKFGSEQVILTFQDKAGSPRHLDCLALLVKQENRAHHIKAVAQDITERMARQKENVQEQKLKGVLEMAGGVAHRLNQPLTILNNLIDDVIAEVPPGTPGHEKVVMMQQQLSKMNEITKKISNVKKYAAMDYVAGIKIVDIDRAS